MKYYSLKHSQKVQGTAQNHNTWIHGNWSLPTSWVGPIFVLKWIESQNWKPENNQISNQSPTFKNYQDTAYTF